jgi:hypothetical protein
MSTTGSSQQPLVPLLTEYLINGLELTGHSRHEPPPVSREIHNPVIGDIVFHELGELVADDPKLLEAIKAARGNGTDSPRAALLDSVESRLELDLRNNPDLVQALCAVLSPHSETAEQPCRSSRFARVRGIMTRVTAGALIAGVIASVLAATVWFDSREVATLTSIELFATAVLALLPGWLFVRFLAFRAGALWNEYVLNLHRLKIDEPQHLPRPPENSTYYHRWWTAGGWVRERAQTIYQQKFDAYYGRNISQATTQQDPIVRYETLFPVLLTTAVLAVGWVAVFQGGRLLTEAEPSRLTDMLGYAFVGAYVFNLQTFVRRFFQGDLKASAYAGGLVRIITALVLVAVLYWLPAPDLQGRSGAVVAFVVGIFPLVGIQVLTRAASVLLRTIVPTLRSDYPLSDLDGLNIWYETRMLEEGIEDMQNLTTMNLVDVMLHTRVPLGRLVDWVDQAFLYMNLCRSPRLAERKRAARNAELAATSIRQEPNWAKTPSAALEPFEPTHPRELLRRCGIRNATAFVTVFRPLITAGTDNSPEYVTAKSAERWLISKDAAWKGALRPLTQVLVSETALQPVWAWRHWCQHENDHNVPTRTNEATTNGGSHKRAAVGPVAVRT